MFNDDRNHVLSGLATGDGVMADGGWGMFVSHLKMLSLLDLENQGTQDHSKYEK